MCYEVDNASTYLERSKSAPIDVVAVATPLVSPSDLALELVIPHLGRVRSMRILPTFGETLPALFGFRSPTPLLQHLEISGFPRGHMSRLPRNFLGCHLPSLRSLTWGDSSLIPAPFPLSNFTHLSYDAAEAPGPLRVVLGLISFAPHLEHLSISILDPNVSPDPPPVHDIHLDSLRHLELLSGAALSLALPHFKAPQLKEFSLILPSRFGVETIADLLPSDSYPLITEVTSMDFYAGPGDCGIKLSGEGIRFTVATFFPRANPSDNFFSMTSFSFKQITRLVLRMMAKPIAGRIGEFTNLELLDLIRCEEDAEVFSALSQYPGQVSLATCPHLAAMRVAFYNPIAHVVDSFKQMVRSRKEAGNPLMTVNLMFFDRMDMVLDLNELNKWLGQPPVLE